MLDAETNKMIDSSQVTKKDIENVTVRAVSVSLNEYHFPGAPEFLPMSVRATTIEEATEIWKSRRQTIQNQADGVASGAPAKGKEGEEKKTDTK